MSCSLLCITLLDGCYSACQRQPRLLRTTGMYVSHLRLLKQLMTERQRGWVFRHLNSVTHASTHSLVNHSDCATAGIYNCCFHSCPASPKTFFSSLRALNDHCHQTHPPPRPPSPPDITHPPPTDPPSPLSLSTRLLHQFSPPNTTNHWEHGLDFIDSVYHHEPPDFRTTWRHLIRSRNLSAFSNLQASIIRAIVEANTTCNSIDSSAPFWWLLFHLDMLIFAPSTKEQRNHISIGHTIRDRINAAYCGDIAFLGGEWS